MLFTGLGRSVMGKTVPSVLETSGTVFPVTDRPRPVNNYYYCERITRNYTKSTRKRTLNLDTTENTDRRKTSYNMHIHVTCLKFCFATSWFLYHVGDNLFLEAITLEICLLQHCAHRRGSHMKVAIAKLELQGFISFTFCSKKKTKNVYVLSQCSALYDSSIN